MNNENHKQLYQELVARYEEFIKGSFTIHEGYAFTRALNHEYLEHTGNYCSCFNYRLSRYYEEQRKKLERQAKRAQKSSHSSKSTKNSAKTKPKSQQEKLLARLATGDLAAEKGLAFSLLNNGLHFEKREIDMGYRAWWIGDCIARAIVDENGVFLSENDRQTFQMNNTELQDLEEYLATLSAENPQEYANRVPQVTIADFQIRDMLNKRLSNAEIYSLVKEFTGAVVERKTQRFSKDGDRWVSYFEFDNICKVRGIETGKYSARNQHPEHAYKFIFDRAASIDFWNSVRIGLFDCRPPSYYKLKAGSQLIFRSVGWTNKPSDLELEQLCRIAKIKTKNKTWQQKNIEGYLTELKQAGYISHWTKRIKKASGTRQIRYTIHKAQRLPSE